MLSVLVVLVALVVLALVAPRLAVWAILGAAALACIGLALFVLAMLPPRVAEIFIVLPFLGAGLALYEAYMWPLDESGEDVALRNACDRVTKSRGDRVTENAWRGGEGLR